MLLRLQPAGAVASSSSSSHPSASLQFPPVRVSNSPSCSSSADLSGRGIRYGRGNRVVSQRLCCKASEGSGMRREEGNLFLPASLLVSETIRHYNLRKWGYLDETTKWNSSSGLKSTGIKSDASPFSHGFLRRFHSPTIFLKVSCDGDMILPIVVGEFAIERLIKTLKNEQAKTLMQENPQQFQFVKNLIGVLGYEVKKVWITKRVVNTYFAQIFLGKTAEIPNISIDSRPSDAIHMASGFKAPIYVSKEIVLKDAIRLYGSRRRDASKTVYDVFLDSATEGPDLLMEELDLVRKMNTAVMDERYRDAAMFQDKLNKLRITKPET